MINPIGPIGSASAQGVGAAPKTEAPDPAMLKAAKDFESIFVRQMLKSVEKTTAAGMGTQAAAGQSRLPFSQSLGPVGMLPDPERRRRDASRRRAPRRASG